MGWTLAFARFLATAPGHRSVECTLTKRLPTQVFEFQGAGAVPHTDVAETTCQTGRSELLSFRTRRGSSRVPPLATTTLIPNSVRELDDLPGSANEGERRLYFVLEHEEPIGDLPLSQGECFEIENDETPAGSMIFAVRTIAGAWPDTKTAACG